MTRRSSRRLAACFAAALVFTAGGCENPGPYGGCDGIGPYGNERDFFANPRGRE